MVLSSFEISLDTAGFYWCRFIPMIFSAVCHHIDSLMGYVNGKSSIFGTQHPRIKLHARCEIILFLKAPQVDAIYDSKVFTIDVNLQVFGCSHCTMKFVRLLSLYKHLHTQHSDLLPDTDDERLTCVVCDFRAHSHKSLLVHMRKHNNQDTDDTEIPGTKLLSFC